MSSAFSVRSAPVCSYPIKLNRINIAISASEFLCFGLGFFVLAALLDRMICYVTHYESRPQDFNRGLV